MSIRIEEMADEIARALEDYADLVVDDMKESVKAASKTAKNEIKKTAPRKTGAYAKSWAVKTERENSMSIVQIIHSKNRYQIAHLLEKGHAKRGGGRVPGRPHIAPAEQKAIRVLEEELTRRLS